MSDDIKVMAHRIHQVKDLLAIAKAAKFLIKTCGGVADEEVLLENTITAYEKNWGEIK